MNNHITWQPTASLPTLKKRAELIKHIRLFFEERHVLEVETPLLAQSSAMDPSLQSLESLVTIPGSSEAKKYYLQTSPEFHMKRLLAAESGPIFQICKVFRDGEKGQHHNPEFTLLEWYRPGYDHHQLMNEMDDFLQKILSVSTAERKTYADIFIENLKINPHTATIEALIQCADRNNLQNIQGMEAANKDQWLHLLMSHLIEPTLGLKHPLFIYDYPASQAALAKINESEYPVAERFEVYFLGIELANGFHELIDADEQSKRFHKELTLRTTQGLPVIPMDERFLAALSHGLPSCAGVALGIDRLCMLATQNDKLSNVLSFDIHQA